MNIITWFASKLPFECFKIIGIVIKAAFHASVCHGNTAAEQIPGYGYPFFDNVLINTYPCIFFKLPAQIELADKEPLRDGIK